MCAEQRESLLHITLAASTSLKQAKDRGRGKVRDGGNYYLSFTQLCWDVL